MALGRLPVEGPLGDYLDALAAIPAELAGLYREMEGDPDAEMMTHPELGAMLEVLVRATGGRSVLEVGTFVGTSSGWMARGLEPAGHIDTLEADPGRAARAEAFFDAIGVGDRVTVHRGPAGDTLPSLVPASYDLCYIDADKPGYAGYLEHAVRLVRSGGLIVADNVLYGGRVADRPGERGDNADALVAFTRAALDHPRLRTSVLTVGDGITLSAVV